MIKPHSELKAYQRSHRERFPEGLGLRVHRALSWLGRADLEDNDPDSRFLFLWIAFNSAYACELGRAAALPESRKFSDFLGKLCDFDTEREIYNIVWQRYPGDIRQLLDNRYVFQPFWDFHNGQPDTEDWEERFRRHKQAAHRALGSMDTAKLLSVVFSSLYTLRNRIVHGGATWNSRVNRDQIELGCGILGDFVPVIVDLMMRNHSELWGDACYPVIDQ